MNLIGLLDGIIGLDYWMVFVHPTSDVSRPAGAFLAGFFFFVVVVYVILSKMVINCQKMSFLEQIF